ncbi:ADP-ribose pyrophosphatase [Thiohalobacter thiocyanaticus]|uniref:ADP-ribose pyrophosphatase n=1 Tax=Thiohalobacter thiocyanaticus TaxID=585455 RepID=A0A1Z4VRD4_9GAMM|nr:ADP-ribose pyrophosphatase [Thiohalobacter thiocyanaticus]
MNEPPVPETPKKAPSEATRLVTSAVISAAGQIIGGWLTGRGNQPITGPQKGTVDYYKNIFINSKWFSPIIFLAIFIISLGALVDGAAKIYCVGVKLCSLVTLCSASCQL